MGAILVGTKRKILIASRALAEIRDVSFRGVDFVFTSFSFRDLH